MAAPLSPLTQLLHETKPWHQELIARREYHEADALRRSCIEQAAAMRESLKDEIARRHDTERRRLLLAKQLAMQRARERVEAETQAIHELWDAKEHAHQLRQEQRFELFERTVRQREASKPAVLSSYVRDLQRSEKRLADFHEYDEAAMVRRKIKDREVVERNEAETEKQDRVNRALQMKREQMLQEEASRRAMAKNELHLARCRALMEEERVAKQFSHVERDMTHSHSLEMAANPLTKAYEAPPFVTRRPAATQAATRGSEYLRRMQGSKYAIPSLCELYHERPPEEPATTTAEAVLAACGLPLPKISVPSAHSAPNSPAARRR